MHHGTQMETLRCLKHTLGFLKSATYVLQCQEWKNMLATCGCFLSLYLSWLLNRSLNHHCIAHTPALVTDLTVHFCCLFFGWGYIEIPVVLNSQCLIVGLCVSVGLTDSRVVVWRWSGLLLRPALSLPFCFFSFLFLSTYFYQSYSWTPSGNDM